MQWEVSTNGGLTFEAVLGATSPRLTVPATTLFESGQLYRAVFTNLQGSVTTEPATLTVNPPPPQQADLAITKSDSPDPVIVGQTLTYSIGVSNGGPDGATGVSVTDTLPLGAAFQSATSSQGSCIQAAGTVTCKIGSLANGASATIEIKVTPQNTGTITNTASVTGDQSDFNATNNSATESTTVHLPGQTDLAVTKSDSPDPVLVGETLTYSIGVSNAGPDEATGVTVTDALSAGTAFQSASSSQGSCIQAAGTVTCTIGSLASGSSATIDIKVTPQNAETIINTANVTGDQGDPNTANNSAAELTVVNPQTDLAVTKSDSPDPVIAGETLTYSIGVSNAGPNEAPGVTVTDALSAETTFQSATTSQGSCAQAAGTVTCKIGLLASFASASIEIKVTPQKAGTITNTVSVAGDRPIPTPPTTAPPSRRRSARLPLNRPT